MNDVLITPHVVCRVIQPHGLVLVDTTFVKHHRIPIAESFFRNLRRVWTNQSSMTWQQMSLQFWNKILESCVNNDQDLYVGTYLNCRIS